jgi:hypothetical protein
MGFVQFASCPTPFHLRCFRCKTKLRIEKHAWFIVAVGVLVGVAVVGARKKLELSTPVFFGAVIAAIFVFEAAAFFALRWLGAKLTPR